jgi:hypothetical protein
MLGLMIGDRQDDLPHIVLARRTTGRFPSRIYRGEQQPHKDRNDDHYHQQLNQGKSTTGCRQRHRLTNAHKLLL